MPATTATTARAIATATSSVAASPRATASAYRDDRWDGRNDRDGRDRDGWNRGSYRDPGQARGFSDGYRKGVEDRRDNHRFEPTRFKEVRQGTAPGYDDDFGSRERYTLGYRDGFRLGYEDGFRSAYARR